MDLITSLVVALAASHLDTFHSPANYAKNWERYSLPPVDVQAAYDVQDEVGIAHCYGYDPLLTDEDYAALDQAYKDGESEVVLGRSFGAGKKLKSEEQRALRIRSIKGWAKALAQLSDGKGDLDGLQHALHAFCDKHPDLPRGLIVQAVLAGGIKLK